MIEQKLLPENMKTLQRRRERLRMQLKRHFLTPVTQRNYPEFEKLVDELDRMRQIANALKTKEGHE